MIQVLLHLNVNLQCFDRGHHNSWTVSRKCPFNETFFRSQNRTTHVSIKILIIAFKLLQEKYLRFYLEVQSQKTTLQNLKQSSSSAKSDFLAYLVAYCVEKLFIFLSIVMRREGLQSLICKARASGAKFSVRKSKPKEFCIRKEKKHETYLLSITNSNDAFFVMITSACFVVPTSKELYDQMALAIQ